MIDIYETVRACQAGGYITQHFEDPAYKKDVKASLKSEAVQRLTNLYWKFSTDVLKILMQVKTDVSETPEPEDILDEYRAAQANKAQAALRRQRSTLANSAAFQSFKIAG